VLALALLALRLAAGLTFAAHGAQKAFGWWEGPGPVGWRGAIERMGFRPLDLFVLLSVGAELGGGILLALGFLTPLAAAALIAQSIVIIGQAHWAKGFFSNKGGFEFPLLLGIVAGSICLAGPGPWSLDAFLGLPFPEPVRAAIIPLAISVGLAIHFLPRTTPKPAPAPAAASSAGPPRPRDSGGQLRRA
jgi:putative oxidoreductase